MPLSPVFVQTFVALLALSQPAGPQQASGRTGSHLKTPSEATKFLGFRPQMRPMNFDVVKQLNLKPLRGGGYFYRGKEKERFDARIFPDGSVEFREAGAFQLSADVLCFGVICPKASPKRGLFGASKAKKKDTEATRRRRKARRIATQVALGILAGAVAVPGLDGTQMNQPWSGPNAGVGRPGSPAVGVLYSVVRFGRTGQLTIHQQNFLERTRSFRLELAVLAQEAYMRKALTELSRELASIEKNTLEPATKRRARLIELWERFDVHYEQVEVRDAIAKRVHDSMGTKLVFARKQILAFARRVFPQGGKMEFRASELADVNKGREPAQGFYPYRKTQ